MAAVKSIVARIAKTFARGEIRDAVPRTPLNNSTEKISISLKCKTRKTLQVVLLTKCKRWETTRWQRRHHQAAQDK